MLIHDWQLRRFEWYDPVSMGGMINDVIFRFPSLRHGELEQKKSVDSEHGSEAKFTPYQIIFITFTYRNKIIYMVTDRIMEKKTFNLDRRRLRPILP